MQGWYGTFHGGARSDAWNNIHAFELAGAALGTVLDPQSLPTHLQPRELRGVAFGPDGDLYVANAYQGASQVLRLAGVLGADGRHHLREVYVASSVASPGS